MTDTIEYTRALFISQPIPQRKPVGYWIIGDNFQVALYKKPTDEHIKNHYEMLGWEWKEQP